MSTRYEGASAKSTTITVHKAGEEIGADVVPEGEIALAFNYDEVFYLQGGAWDIAELLQDGLDKIKEATKRPPAGVTGNERTQRLDMIAELLWNSDGSPAMDDEAYAAKYKKDAAEQYAEYEAGNLEPWWWKS